jgi:hypothetical protein
MNNPDHISESLETIFWVKILKFFNVDPGWKNFGSGSSGSATLTENTPLSGCTAMMLAFL